MVGLVGHLVINAFDGTDIFGEGMMLWILKKIRLVW